MHRKSNPAIVVADFNNVEITYWGVEIEARDKKKVKIPRAAVAGRADRFLMTLVEKDDPAT